MEWINLGKAISRKEGKQILMYMKEIIDRYGYVTFADFLDLVGSKKAVYTDNRKGWRSLKGARISLFKKYGTYRIKLPESI